MSTVSVSPLAQPDHATARRAMVPAALTSCVLIVFFALTRANSLPEILTMVPLGLAATAVVYGLVVRRGLRRDAAPVPALVMSVLSVALFVAFWSGLPLVLGGGGALLGYAGKRAAARSGICIAALVIGILGVLAYLGIYIGDWIADPGVAAWLG